MTYAERMAEIEKRDRARRFLREIDADTGTPHTDYLHSRNISGEPSEANRVHRANAERNSFDRMARPKWSAVKVTLADGTVAHLPARAFRAESTAKKAATIPTETRETEQARRVRLLSQAGNNSEVD